MTSATTQAGQTDAPRAPLGALYATMALIRAFETRVAELYRDGEIPGFVHTSLGQEAVAAGVGAALREDDYLATTHRGHGHVLAKGADVDGMMAELFAKATGLCRGKGGSMHVADPARGILGANAIVGASLPLAVGAALSSKLRAAGPRRGRLLRRGRRQPGRRSTSRSTSRRSGTCRCCSSARTTSTPSSPTAAR